MTLLVVALVVVGLLVSGASAMRRPYGWEKRELAEALGTLPECIAVRVSTVNQRWARVRSRDFDCLPADGLVVMHAAPGRGWRVRYQGPNDEPRSTPCRYFRPVPRRVARDLHLCGRRAH